ncbi:hypothetical protein LC087_01235 [Bacillus carboniphilus]|uniref:Uncharacterized protein n=1 Tax=Bacillus carboniphilus TaxID=86663 RepID=A0ABY9JU07_9BACI|nr:hypothetical protein [Bacillus carboniphilus]WLR42891.1 hypothetical protein LC087_01235 [Bacillus carboniphilus]
MTQKQTIQVPSENQIKSKDGKQSQPNMDQIVAKWLPRVFIFVFILGIIWAFIAAAERGWINPIVRVFFWVCFIWCTLLVRS